ncbi:unnamed protein product, partial [Nesidiocoris tenuis]
MENRIDVLLMHSRKLRRRETIPTVDYSARLDSCYQNQTMAQKVACDMQMKKANIALGNIYNIMSKAKVQSWAPREKLFDATVTPTLMYSAEIW